MSQRDGWILGQSKELDGDMSSSSSSMSGDSAELFEPESDDAGANEEKQEDKDLFANDDEKPKVAAEKDPKDVDNEHTLLEEMRCSPCEEAPIRMTRNPGDPTPEERTA